QGEAGVLPGDPGFFSGIRRLCDERGILLIMDEVQTGLGRAGTRPLWRSAPRRRLWEPRCRAPWPWSRCRPVRRGGGSRTTVRSGRGRPRPVWTSSMMSRMPRSSQSRLMPEKKPGSPGRTPASPCRGSSRMAPTVGSTAASKASRSFQAACLKPSGRGWKGSCFSGWPVAARVARVRPWNDRKADSTTCRPRPWCLRANLMAASFASAPEFWNSTWPGSVSPVPDRIRLSSRVATSIWGSVPNRLETCMRVPAWSAIAAAIRGWLCPRLVTARPPRKSRYLRPSASKSSVPAPRTNLTGGGP
ncbi:MAG: hypothetical protein DSY73_03920, partial [Actinobacteria bacterium]